MAIKYSDLNAMDKRPLDEDELKMVSEIEAYIDDQIIQQFKRSDEIRIPLEIVKFDYDPNERSATNLKPIRKVKMYAELKRRYVKANWRVSELLWDRSELPGTDYLILRGNRI